MRVIGKPNLQSVCLVDEPFFQSLLKEDFIKLTCERDLELRLDLVHPSFLITDYGISLNDLK